MTQRGKWTVGGVMLLIAALLTAAFALSSGGTQPAKAQSSGSTTGGDTVHARIGSISPVPPWRTPDATKALQRIAFGSCLDQKKPQPIWADILKDKPDLFLMVGDNVYGDARLPEMTGLFDAYERQAKQPELAAARAAMPFLAIWDDHDYGRNDGGTTFEGKRLAADAFHAFWQKPREPGRTDAIYYSRIVGPPGKRVQMIFLDTRFDRSDLTKKAADFAHWGHYGPDPDPAKQMLSPEQWTWLEQQLREPAEIRLLVSSIQVLAEGHGWERWGNFSRERERLLKVITDTKVNGIVMLSGDRHHAAIYAQPAERYPLVEITSSALNISYGLGSSKDARLPPLASDIYSGENYGMIDIDWEGRQLELSIRGFGSETKLSRRITFAELGRTP
jgi:alkaline phosphatase D